MASTLSVSQIRELDRRTIEEVGIPGRLLMEVAGYGAFTEVRDAWSRADPPPSPIAIVAGKGNNAGDGFVIARFCAATGIPVRVLAAGDPGGLPDDARWNLELLAAFGVEVEPLVAGDLAAQLASCRVTVDALLGTGIRSAVRSPFREIIETLNQGGGPIVSLDLPSGLSGDTGEVLGVAVRADRTVTFGASKHGLELGEGPRHAGEITVVPLPFAPHLWTEVGAAPPQSGSP